ncbi:hypothetical protein DV515_00009168 [Chloebia gouldiae]|uniref:Uncharacterized protein n=1 Tax=Chloebia gouldiae TaxID=44316 RepID=A0A3L8SDZ5_CHLGU|nr:hypothetical protein DV515_00009168 [Chloebia gouldiae]
MTKMKASAGSSEHIYLTTVTDKQSKRRHDHMSPELCPMQFYSQGCGSRSHESPAAFQLSLSERKEGRSFSLYLWMRMKKGTLGLRQEKLLWMWYHVNEAGYEKLEKDCKEKKACRVSMEFTSCFFTALPAQKHEEAPSEKPLQTPSSQIFAPLGMFPTLCSDQNINSTLGVWRHGGCRKKVRKGFELSGKLAAFAQQRNTGRWLPLAKQ